MIISYDGTFLRFIVMTCYMTFFYYGCIITTHFSHIFLTHIFRTSQYNLGRLQIQASIQNINISSFCLFYLVSPH